MATILRFTRAEDRESKSALREIRRDFGLSLSQAAMALDVSAATIENWERGGNERVSTDQLVRAYGDFSAKSGSRAGNNLLFGCYPLRLGRQLLQISVEEMAAQFGYSKAAWLKIESNARSLQKDKLIELEERIRSKFSEICC